MCLCGLHADRTSAICMSSEISMLIDGTSAITSAISMTLQRVPSDRTSVHLCASSLQNLAGLPQCLRNGLGDQVFDGVGLAGFKIRANAFLLAKLLAPFLAPAVFPFSSFILWVGIVGLGSSG